MKDTVLAAVINSICMIWCCRNKLRFEDKRINVSSCINNVIAAVHLVGMSSKGTMSSSIRDFSILKAFNISSHACRAPRITEVTWILPPCNCNWVKCDSDGASRGNPGWSSCGGVFRGFGGAAFGSFACDHGVNSTFFAELMGAIIAIEEASLRGWNNLWLEYDSQLVVRAFQKKIVVPWKVRNRWNNFVSLARSMNFFVCHIYREGNSCVDKLASHGLHVGDFLWWKLFLLLSWRILIEIDLVSLSIGLDDGFLG